MTFSSPLDSQALRLLTIASGDYRRAVAVPSDERAWGFWMQQSSEKALKAWLVVLGESPPRTHDIRRLLDMLERLEAETDTLQPLRLLTPYAVKIRYSANSQLLGLDRELFHDLVSKLLTDLADTLEYRL
jgi:HEPN domain-containing protein